MARYTSFKDFYPYYLSEHRDPTCRGLHYLGSALALTCLVLAVGRSDWRFLPLAVGAGYACAWMGHFFFEKNRPATFTYPFYSFAGDWVMFWDMMRGKDHRSA